jgi:uncharacterized protein YjbI with pentapeptide repeats
LIGVVVAVSLGACSGSGDESSGGVSSPASTDSTAVPDTSVEVTTTEGAAPVPAPSTTTTTEPPPEVVPIGVRWEEVGVVVPDVSRNLNRGNEKMLTVGDDLWLMGPIHNTSYVVRSRDHGVTWQPVPVVAPPESGEQFVTDIVAGAGGRLVASGAISSRCQINDDAGNGFREVGLCKRSRPVLYISDDDGVSWRQIEPSAMVPPGDSTVVLNGLIVTSDGYMAAGTVKSEDWHVRLWSSPDGETWTLDREIRGDGNAMSARQLLTDGETVVLRADEHPCARPGSSAPGWVLGSDWVSKLRIFAGTGIADLTVLSAAEHPFAHEPETIDCEPLFTTPDATGNANATTVQAVGAVIGGVITLLQSTESVEEDSVADPLTDGSQRYTQLIDAEWIVTEVDGVPINAAPQLIDVDGAVGLLDHFAPILPNADGSWSQPSAERTPPVNNGTVGSAWSGGALVVAGIVDSDPYRTDFGPPNVASVAVWRSVESVGELVDSCDFQPNGRCRYVDLSTVAGYPDFAGIDLSGIDLAFADLGEADFTGANFTGATLWEAGAGDATFDGANFAGALLQSATLGSVVGADFTLANVDGADIADATAAIFTGANLQSANLTFDALPVIDGARLKFARFEQRAPTDPSVPYEISLTGLDLAFVSISNSFDGPLLKVVGLDGSTFDFTSFYGVDLTAIDPAVIDLTEARVGEDSICPDGLPPDGASGDTCIRTP